MRKKSLMQEDEVSGTAAKQANYQEEGDERAAEAGSPPLENYVQPISELAYQPVQDKRLS